MQEFPSSSEHTTVKFRISCEYLSIQFAVVEHITDDHTVGTQNSYDSTGLQ